MHKRWIAIGVAMLALLTAACSGGEDATSETTPGSTMAHMPMEDASMNMGNASLPPATGISDAEVVTGPFQLLDTAPVGYDAAAGTAWLARHDEGTTVTIELIGLVPNSPHIAHVHAGSCAEAGGPHFQFDAGGGELPPNEIHLMFDSDSGGVGNMTAENARVAGSGARSLVVHPVNRMDAKVACADLG